MSYVDQSRRPSPASMAAVVAIHGALGAAIVLGLSVSGKLPEIITSTDATNIPIEPPPPPDPVVEPRQTDPVLEKPVAPLPPLDLNPRPVEVDTTLIPLPQPQPSPGLGKAIEPVVPKPTPSFDPVAARAKNNPASWLSDRDYRPGWARQELAGLAKFRLSITAEGRVSDCRITGSTGHAELDEATCTLVTKRARFEPARGGNGEPVAGSYSGSVMWQLPD